jgi:hypothetical protein
MGRGRQQIASYFLPSTQPIAPPDAPIITVITIGSTSVAVRLEILVVPYMFRPKPSDIMKPIMAPAFKPPPSVVILAQLPKIYTQ